jgi:microsomal dipeptidase-like Zn-dependent dipeptidase
MGAVRRTAALATVGALGIAAARVGGRTLVARTERRLCVTAQAPTDEPSERARALHRELLVVDLHADSLLWGRDLLHRSERGHVDVPRLIEGNVALQVFATSTKSPRHLNIERNDDRSDDIILLALAQGWPPATWRSLLARARHMAARADAMARRSGGQLTIIRSKTDLHVYRLRRRREAAITAGLLAIEGAHALDDDPANVDVVADAGFRMMSPSHFFDNAFGGSAHGLEKGGLTEAGREMIGRMEARGMVLDLSHASGPTIAEAVAVSTRPVVVSHTGVRGTCDNARNLSDDQLRAVAGTGGLIGIGFWPTACGGDDAAAIARAIRHAVGVAGVEHVGLGSDFDGAVPEPFDATGMVRITDALLEEGLREDEIGKIMGGNAFRVLAETLPEARDDRPALRAAVR